jgi:RNA polymerase sigma-70 factor, ECF subfamily
MVHRRMRSLAGASASDLDDLIQIAAEQVFRKLPGFEGRSELMTWVYAICYRVLLQHRRWYRRWALRFHQDRADETALLAGVDSSPSHSLERRELVRTLDVALSRLTEQQRAIIVLHDLEELSISEVAQIVACKELTARSRLRDARKRLRAILGSEHQAAWRGEHELTSP